MQTTRVVKSDRQSNMELLRIVAMFMIVVYHTVYYVFYNYRGESPIFASLMTLLHIGVPLFVLISGYFGIKASVKGVIKLYLIILFYNLLFYGIRLIYDDVSFSSGEFLKLWFPFSIGRGLWFFKVYLMLYLISPVLNYCRDKVGGWLLMASGVITFYWGWFAQHPSLVDGKNVMNFIFLYMLGYFLRTIVERKKMENNNLRIGCLIAYLVISVLIGGALYFSTGNIQNIIKRVCYGYNSPVLILMSIFLFLFFSTFDFKSKVVNWIAGSVFAVYCVHENYWFFRSQWYSLLEFQYNNNPGLIFAVILLSECLALFMVAILFDKIRDYVMQPLLKISDIIQKWFVFVSDKVNNRMQDLWGK